VNPNAIIFTEASALINPHDCTENQFFDEFAEISYSKCLSGDLCFSFYSANILDIAYNKWTSETFVKAVENQNKKYNRHRAFYLTHASYERTQKVFSSMPRVNYPLVTLISTTPEVPFIYAGAEIGEKEGREFASVIDWAGGDYELRDHYKKVFNLRNNNNALKHGSITNVWKSGDNTFAYLREYENEKAIVVINFSDKVATSTLDLSFLDKGTTLHDELNNEDFIIDEPGGVYKARVNRVNLLDKPRVNRNAVPASADTGLEYVHPGVLVGKLDSPYYIYPEPLGYGGQFVGQGNIHISMSVFHELHQFGGNIVGQVEISPDK